MWLKVAGPTSLYFVFPQTYTVSLNGAAGFLPRSLPISAHLDYKAQVMIPWNIRKKKKKFCQPDVAARIQTHNLVNTKQWLNHFSTLICTWYWWRWLFTLPSHSYFFPVPSTSADQYREFIFRVISTTSGSTLHDTTDAGSQLHFALPHAAQQVFLAPFYLEHAPLGIDVAVDAFQAAWLSCRL